MSTTSQTRPFGVFLLFTAAIIWGFAFSAQSAAGEILGAFTVNAVRFFVGGFFLVPCILLFDRKKGRHLFGVKGKRRLDVTRREWLGGIACGFLLCLATALQQFGIERTETGKAAFITALYVVMVPLFALFLGKRPRAIVWVAIGVAVLGFYLLTANLVPTSPGLAGFWDAVKQSGFRLSLGDLLVFLCAVAFTFHVLTIDGFSEGTDGVRLSCIQFFVAGILALPFMLFLEHPAFADILRAALPILYLGVCSCGVAYTCQVVGQKYVDVSLAPIILSLESVFGVLGSALLLGERQTPVQYIGCVVVFLAVLLAQMPARKK